MQPITSPLRVHSNKQVNQFGVNIKTSPEPHNILGVVDLRHIQNHKACDELWNSTEEPLAAPQQSTYRNMDGLKQFITADNQSPHPPFQGLGARVSKATCGIHPVSELCKEHLCISGESEWAMSLLPEESMPS